MMRAGLIGRNIMASRSPWLHQQEARAQGLDLRYDLFDFTEQGLDDGLLASTAQGRHKYFRFASEQVAQLVESLMRVAPRRQVATPPKAQEPIRAARFCYDHLAGTLGTRLLASMLRKGWLAKTQDDPRQLDVTAKGEKSLAQLGIDVDAARERRRQFACCCLDWSERQDHLGGALGAAMAEQFKAARWIERQKHSRVVRVTPTGVEALQRLGLAAL